MFSAVYNSGNITRLLYYHCSLMCMYRDNYTYLDLLIAKLQHIRMKNSSTHITPILSYRYTPFVCTVFAVNLLLQPFAWSRGIRIQSISFVVPLMAEAFGKLLSSCNINTDDHVRLAILRETCDEFCARVSRAEFSAKLNARIDNESGQTAE